MDLKTVVYYAAMFLQLEDVTEALESDSEYIGETADEIDRLTRCANLVLSETAADYMPLKTREEIYCENGEMLFTQLSKPVIDVFPSAPPRALPFLSSSISTGLFCLKREVIPSNTVTLPRNLRLTTLFLIPKECLRAS